MRASGESISLARPASAVTATFSGRPFSPISNRNFQQLEIVVIAKKPSPKLSLIDNEKLLFRKIACRAGCLPTIKPARSKQPRYRTTTLSTNFRPTNPATSNRQWKGLEIAVTPTKHSPDPSLIDNEKQLFRKIACRAGCLPTIKPALSNSTSTSDRHSLYEIPPRQPRHFESQLDPTRNRRNKQKALTRHQF